MSGLDTIEAKQFEHMTTSNEDLIGLSINEATRDRVSDGARVLQRKVVHMKRHDVFRCSNGPQTRDASA